MIHTQQCGQSMRTQNPPLRLTACVSPLLPWFSMHQSFMPASTSSEWCIVTCASAQRSAALSARAQRLEPPSSRTQSAEALFCSVLC